MKSSRISDAAVLKATGKNKEQWFSLLDKAGAKKMKHGEIAQYVYDKYLGTPGKVGGTNVATSGGWWSQMVTVEYERERGIRKVNEHADGFLVAVSKTVPGTASALQKKWNMLLKSPEVLKKKLQRLPSKTKRPMIRYQATIGRVVVMFSQLSKEKSQIIVEATKLPKKSLVEKERAFWKKVLSEFEEK